MAREKHNRRHGPSVLEKLVLTIGIKKVLTIGLIAILVILLGSAAFCIKTVNSTSSKTTQFGLRDIGELATQAGYFTNVQVIDDAKKLWGWSVPLTHSKVIYSYDGTVKAGLDFADVGIDANELTKTVTITLPEIKFLGVEVDENSLEIYDEATSIFTPVRLEQFNEGLQKMKEEVIETATANGILENARDNAVTLLKGFLSGLYDPAEYTFEFVDA